MVKEKLYLKMGTNTQEILGMVFFMEQGFFMIHREKENIEVIGKMAIFNISIILEMQL